MIEWPRRTGVELVRDAKVGAAGHTITRLKITAIAADTLTCRTWDGDEEGDEDIVVAKPWLMQANTWEGMTRNGYEYSGYSADGQSRTSTRTSDLDSETQVVVPAYVVGDEIWAATAETGITDATHIDVNLDGRAWAKQ